MLYLTEEDVQALITMPETIPVVRDAFAALAAGQADNVPRRRAKAPGIILHNMHAAAGYLGVVGAKLYTTTREGARFHVLLYAADTGTLTAMIEADHLGRMRTGAATGVASDLLARSDAASVGLFGAGRQARWHLEAVAAVRPITKAVISCRDPDRRRTFAEEMSQRLDINVRPAGEPRECVTGQDIVITATTAKTPLFEGTWIEPGTHLNVIGSNDPRKAEIDVATVARADRIVCDSIEACQLEAGDFVGAIEAGAASYDTMSELSPLVAGSAPARQSGDEITLFKSVGLAIEDVALGHEIVKRARQHGRGRELWGTGE